MIYVIHTKVTGVSERSRIVRTVKTGRKTEDGKDELATEHEDLGWFITLEGSWEALYLGKDKPALEKGDRVKLTIEKDL